MLLNVDLDTEFEVVDDQCKYQTIYTQVSPTDIDETGGNQYADYALIIRLDIKANTMDLWISKDNKDLVPCDSILDFLHTSFDSGDKKLMWVTDIDANPLGFISSNAAYIDLVDKVSEETICQEAMESFEDWLNSGSYENYLKEEYNSSNDFYSCFDEFDDGSY